MMRQYLSFKEKHADAVLFFRMGDFYEMFFADAELAARELGLTLTTRDKGKADAIPMAGVPFHAADGYIAKLVRKGYRVAVCEQVGDPAKSKGLVDRSVVEVVTPGTAVNEELVPESANNFVAAGFRYKDVIGFAAADVGTGEFLLEDIPLHRFEQTVSQLAVNEWVLPEGEDPLPGDDGAAVSVVRPGWWFEPARGKRSLEQHFGVASLRGFDCHELQAAPGAGGAILDYLREVRGPELGHMVRAKRLRMQDHMVLDETTRRNLELTIPLSGDDASLTLLGTLDRTVTSLGARRLRARLERPLVDRTSIEHRLDTVAELLERPDETELLGGVLATFRDLERLLAKTSCGKANPRDVRAMGEGCLALPALRARLEVFQTEMMRRLTESVPDLSELGETITRAVVESPPASVGDGTVFAPGWNAELDELRADMRGGKQWIAKLQEGERERTGIPTLKVGYNKVFGYYLEVSAAHQKKVPEDYIRKQTLVNAERYVTPELKKAEERIMGAEERVQALERALFAELCRQIVGGAEKIQTAADTVGDADVFVSLARVARTQHYTRPEVTEESVLSFTEARHPVVENMLPPGEFVPNDLDLAADTRRVAIVTGPNMAGKSTYLRQTGLLTIMAQMGSFVPAARARVGIADRVFTRVGASDNIARGRSTFMVEMEETATILNAATGRSLVLLDEVGRGTSTYDGLSIAWAVTEHLHDRKEGRPRTLFATHFHELTELAGALSGVINLTVQVKEWNGKVIFLRKIVEGSADKSYGIHVAELAGLPPTVVSRATEVLARLETGRFARGNQRDTSLEPQLTLFEPVGHEMLAELDDLDPRTTTPLEALSLLTRWKERHGRKGS